MTITPLSAVFYFSCGIYLFIHSKVHTRVILCFFSDVIRLNLCLLELSVSSHLSLQIEINCYSAQLGFPTPYLSLVDCAVRCVFHQAPTIWKVKTLRYIANMKGGEISLNIKTALRPSFALFVSWCFFRVSIECKA